MQNEGKFKLESGTVQVTERTFEQYVDRFDLPEDYFKNRGTVLDVGSGFADFVRYTNEHYGSTGTKVYGIYPVYAFLKPNYKELDKSLEGSGLFLIFSYGKFEQQMKESGMEKHDELRDKFVAEFYRHAKESGKYLAGSHQELPIKTSSVDCVLANNVFIHLKDPNILINGLIEFSRVIKENGEFRITPLSPDALEFNDQGKLVLEDYRDEAPEELRKRIKGKNPDGSLIMEGRPSPKEIFYYLKILERLGIQFYGVENAFISETGNKAHTISSLIGVRGEKIPVVDKNQEEVSGLRRLYFDKSGDNYEVPSELIWKK
jgi:hypothetical protein